MNLTPRDFDQGRLLHRKKNNRTAHVAVLGYDLAHALFPSGEAVDRMFMMDGAEFTVMGVFAKAKGGFFGENGLGHCRSMIPLQTARSRYPQVDRFMITVKAQPGHRQEAYR